jgi:uncharacterized protein YndB with AHSA1/START domain
VSQFPVSVTDDGAMVTASLRLPGTSPERALSAFTDPATLARWWGGELASTLEPGTPYTVTFTQLGRAITGEVVAYDPASHLEYTWQWDHEPEAVRRTVAVTVTPRDAGTTVTITHGPHADAGPDPSEAEAAARTEHREGWEFFLPRLASVILKGEPGARPPEVPSA